MPIHKLIIYFIICGGSFMQCSYKNYIPKDDYLYDGASVEVIAVENKKGSKDIKNEALKLIRPKRNSKILGARIKLSLYNWGNKSKKTKGFRAMVKRKLGEAPVLFSAVNPKVTREVITTRLFNMGYFKASVSFTTIEEEKKINVKYTIFPNGRFHIKSYNITAADQRLSGLIAPTMKKSLIEIGKPYSLDVLKKETSRIDEILKDEGYYFFNADYLIFKLDSSAGNNSINLALQVKPDVPSKGIRVFSMDSVTVSLDTNYVLNTAPDTMLAYENKVHLKLNHFFNPKPISRYTFLKEGEIYKRVNQQLTLNRLMGMSIFKYVNVDIYQKDSNKLNAQISLNPLARKSITLEVLASTKSNNFIGPGLNVSYINRNLLKGAERLTVNFRGALETQLNGEFKGLYTFEVGPQINLTLPRFLLPFPIVDSNMFTPQTFFNADFSFLRRVNYFDMRSLKFSAGYRWKETIAKQHELTPIGISYFNIRNISIYFMDLLKANPALANRYIDQLIVDLGYSYTYNEQVFPEQRNQFYFNGNGSLAGNSLALLSKIGGAKELADGTKTFFGVAYAQYARFDIDLRNYFRIHKSHQIAARMVVGVGLPYGNSQSMPYVKGFFIGGASSVRAFPVNSVGPGTYRLADSLQGSFFLQPGGDIKLEWNLEYRFPIVSIVKGALFIDAGNTWLKRTTYEGEGRFDRKTFLKEIASGIGFGIRADLNFFVIRLDVATPLMKPWLPLGERWVLDDFNLKDKKWRGQNIILNIAIGYPF